MNKPRILLLSIIGLAATISAQQPSHTSPGGSEASSTSATASKDSPNPEQDDAKPVSTDRSPELSSIEILSDVDGIDFRPYLRRAHPLIQSQWEPLIPDIAEWPFLKSGTVVVTLRILKNGEIRDVKIEKSSGDRTLDEAAAKALSNSSPLPALPDKFTRDSLVLRARFLYNPNPDTKGKSEDSKSKNSSPKSPAHK